MRSVGSWNKKLEIHRFRVLLPAVLAAGLVLTSCAPPKGPTLQPDTSQAKRFFMVGDFEEAIAAYAEMAEQYPNDKSLLSEYSGVVEKIQAKADASFDAGDFQAAEKIYLLLSANFSRFSPFEGSLSFGPPRLRQRVLECQMVLSERRARHSLAAGDYPTALDSYKALTPEALRDPDVSAGLKRIMEELKRLADTALARKDFVAAGKGYAALGSDYALAEQAGFSLSFSRNAADKGIKKCRAQLTKDGLDQYRKGKLEEAITIWRGLLEFDPDNAEIKKAVETASGQLEKLKKG
jgi:tetratricopeptide (TPR) repeat protein